MSTTPPQRPGRGRALVALVACGVLAGATSCTSTPASEQPVVSATPAAPMTPATSATPTSSAGEVLQRQAQLLTQVTSPHPSTGMTLLEGPVLTGDGGLYLVDVTAPPGAGKVLRVDLGTGEVRDVLTDASSAWTSLQVSPRDGRMYMTDFAEGSIDTATVDGQDLRTFFTGAVQGTTMQPDDLTFDPEGNLYVSDTTGFDEPTAPDQGRVVRISADSAAATVLADQLPAPNGISFTTTYDALWLSQYSAGRVDVLGLSSERTSANSLHPGIWVDAGHAQVDSNAVDASGNVYQGLQGQPRVLVYAATGEQVAVVDIPVPAAGSWSATNVAITPGSSQAYVVLSGPSGGFVYSFEAFGEGIRQSNGG